MTTRFSARVLHRFHEEPPEYPQVWERFARIMRNNLMQGKNGKFYFPSDSKCWLKMTDEITEEGYRVFVCDTPGHDSTHERVLVVDSDIPIHYKNGGKNEHSL